MKLLINRLMVGAVIVTMGVYLLGNGDKGHEGFAIIEDTPIIYKYESDSSDDTEDINEFIGEINMIIDDWNTYKDSQYVPVLPQLQKENIVTSTLKPSQGFDNLVRQSLVGVDVHPMFGEVLDGLNPYRAENKVFTYGWVNAFGVTQINVKLIPLANLHYGDFETNPSSQFRFLNDYIKVKVAKGLNAQQIINSYKLCENN